MNNVNETLAVQSEKLKLLYSASMVAVISSTVLATIFAYMQREVVASSIVIAWLSVVMLVALFRAALVIAYQHTKMESYATTQAWLKRFRFGVLVSSLVWGSASFLMFPANDPQHQMLLIIMLAGLSAGGVVSYLADLVSAIAFSASIVIPLSIRLYMVGDDMGLAMSIVGLIYLGFLTLRSRQSNLNLLDNIMLRLDIRAKKDTELASKECHQAVLDGAMDGFWLLDQQGYLLEVNGTYCVMSGYNEQELLTMHISTLDAIETSKDLAARLQTIMNLGRGRFETYHRRKDGSTLRLEISVQYREINGGQFVVFLRDTTKHQQAADEIEHLAFYDTLTQLPNRRLLFDRLGHTLANSARGGRAGALLFIGIDNFKKTNDFFGHAVGDLLLKQVAERLTASLRQSDTLARPARLGGDEFVVVLEDLSEHEAEATAQVEVVCKKILSIINQPFKLTTQEHQSTVSIGVAFYGKNPQSCEDLLQHADIAMYQAKKNGRNTVSFFNPEMLNVVHSRIELERDLKRAIEEKQFQLYYQIQTDSFDRPFGVEALIRWVHPERGLLSPSEFISLAEETGLILLIEQWVLETACSQLKAWQQNSLTRNLVLSINVSAKQFLRTDYAAQVLATMQQHGIDPILLKLEITESVLLESFESAIATMNALKKIGVQISLDDFGTGYSSLQYLKRLPINQLKIDQSFVRDIVVDGNDQAIVSTIIAMARSMKLEVIAEGVETEEQRQLLLHKGCMNYQGYLFGKPVPIEQFEAAIRLSEGTIEQLDVTLEQLVAAIRQPRRGMEQFGVSMEQFEAAMHQECIPYFECVPHSERAPHFV
jgi:diguanylate cyclase (GGDEF)-like protein/PAS domain S-box-containing protein